MIKFNNVSFGYAAGKFICKDLSLTIKDGEWLTVLGPNGSGKTTFAMLLNGLLLPQLGEVTVDDNNTKDVDGLNEVRKLVGFVFQNPDNQIVGATVEEDVAFGPCNLGLPREEIIARVDRSLAILGLEDYRNHAPHMLSGGQKQKVALAGALAMEPKYLVLDEACSMLDPKTRESLWNAVAKLHKELGITIISISHFPEEALLGTGIIILGDGGVEAYICQ
ncbi:MAG: ATP-binding cassette domain-containing protein [Clostridiales bacterium]